VPATDDPWKPSVPVSLPLDHSVPVEPVELIDDSEDPVALSVPLIPFDGSVPLVPSLLNEGSDALCEPSAPVSEEVLLLEPGSESAVDDWEPSSIVLVGDCRIEVLVKLALSDERSPFASDVRVKVEVLRRVPTAVPLSLVLIELKVFRVELRLVLPTVTVVVTVTWPVRFRPAATSGVAPPAVRVVTCVIVVVDVGVFELKLVRSPSPAFVLLPFKVTIVVENTNAVATLAVSVHKLSY